MKATKMRNAQMYRASLSTRSRQLGSPLSKDLRKRYGKRNVRVATGDSVLVMRGEYKDVSGKVSGVHSESGGVSIEGIKKEKGKGDKFDVRIHASNVLVTGLNSDDSWRIARLEGKKPDNKKPGGKAANSKKAEPAGAKKPDSAKKADVSKKADTAKKSDTAKKADTPAKKSSTAKKDPPKAAKKADSKAKKPKEDKK